MKKSDLKALDLLDLTAEEMADLKTVLATGMTVPQLIEIGCRLAIEEAASRMAEPYATMERVGSERHLRDVAASRPN